MPRDLAAYLQDILDAACAIADVMRGVSLEDYRATRSIRSSVEREFIIIGAALRRISALDEELFASIPNSRAIVDFRNLLPHDYGAIDDDSVAGVVYSYLIVLQADVAELRQKLTFANQNNHAHDPPPMVHCALRVPIPMPLCRQVMASVDRPNSPLRGLISWNTIGYSRNPRHACLCQMVYRAA